MGGNLSYMPDRRLASRIYKELKTLDVKTRNNPVYKSAMEANVLKRGNTNGKQTLFKVFNIISHQRNAS